MLAGWNYPRDDRSWLLSAFADFFFPQRCAACQVLSAKFLCRACQSSLRFIGPPLCRRCGLPFDPAGKGGDLCSDCRRDTFHFDRARSVTVYESPIRECLLGFKYSNRSAWATPLGTLMADYWSSQPQFCSEFPITVDAIVPIPLHRSRLKQRGFNQSELLGRQMGKLLKVPVHAGALERTRQTTPQIELTGPQRRQNVRGAFTVSKSAEIHGRAILLVDDVMTTGATLDECARVLRRHGATRVVAYTLARQVMV